MDYNMYTGCMAAGKGDNCMNPINTGRVIASLRKRAGLTQAALAEALDVSDKAVSEWERGIACPDISLFPKLSILLDTDIDDLVNGDLTERDHKWKGIVFLDESAAAPVYTKPLVYYLLQNFLLVGIRDVLVLGGNVQELLGTGGQWGIRLTYEHSTDPSALMRHPQFISSSTMVICGNTLIYGAHLTRKYQYMMLYTDSAVSLVTDGQRPVPILFCHESVWSRLKNRIPCWSSLSIMLADMKPEPKALTRGVTALPMQNADQILTAGCFVRIVEQSEGKELANLDEIADNRSLTRLKLINRRG